MSNSNELSLVSSHSLPRDDAWREFKEKGYVVFKSVIGRELLAEMHAVWQEYFTPFAGRRPEVRRWLMHLPFKPPLYDPRFVESPPVLQIVDRVLGANCAIGYFGSETPLPGAGYMAAHFDLAFLHKRKFLNGPLSFGNKLLGSLNYCYGIQSSVALVDSDEDNAPFEIWPGTNSLTLRSRKPEVLLMPAGSLLVRDIRNLHRGTPHRGAAARPFLSLVYLRSWVPRWKPPEIPSEVYRALTPRSQQLFRFASIGQPVPGPQAWATRPR